MKNKKLFFAIIISTLFLAPNIGSAEGAFSVSGWIPYWRSVKGTESVLPYLDLFTDVNPYVYSVKTDGTLKQLSSLDNSEWVNLQKQSKEKKVKFIPSIMWNDASSTDTILKDSEKRKNHIGAIVAEINKYNFDGIDIDYEGKYASTRPYFSLFLKELKESLGSNKILICTIEARTPLDSRYSSLESIPKDIEYANDFVEINKYCDQVRIMAYDQGRIDLKLNKARKEPYMPIADIEWVEKVMLLAMKDIDKNKLVLGIPSYGYEYDVTETDGQKKYSRLWTFSQNYVDNLITKLNAQPTRNESGELTLVFSASLSPEEIPNPTATRFLVWNDNTAIKQKIELAKKLGIGGVAIFKIDGGQDVSFWEALKGYKQNAPITPATPVVSTNFNRDLTVGSKGEDVKQLQKYLNGKGFTVSTQGPGSLGNETAFFGTATKNALIRFQKENKITPAVGYFGPKTREKISAK